MKSFLLSIGRSAGSSLPTLLAAMSCGATQPVDGLDILHIADAEPDPVLPPLVRDLNRIHSLLLYPDNRSLFPSSFEYASFRPQLPSLQSLSGDPASAALLGALRGKGIPLSYKTDREAVEWAFSVLVSAEGGPEADPLRSWVKQIREHLSGGCDVRVAVLCDLGDPFSSGAAFALLRYLRDSLGQAGAEIALFCLGNRTAAPSRDGKDTFSEAVRDLSVRDLVSRPDHTGTSCADAMWLVSLPSPLYRTEDSMRVVYAVIARQLSRWASSASPCAPGLHVTELPGTLTFQSLGDQSKTFAAFLHASAWLLSDLLPSFSSWCSRPAGLKSISPNTRNGLFRRLMQPAPQDRDLQDLLTVLNRAVMAVLSEVLSLIRSLPDLFRLSEKSDPLWRQVLDACGRTVTVASEYDVSLAEAREGGILDVKPVHRVSMADTDEEKAERRLTDIEAQLKEEEESRNSLFRTAGGCWTVLALRDCRTRCLDALIRAKEQFGRQLDDTGADHLSIAGLSRRIRLLEAAVARCDRDMADRDLIASAAQVYPESSETKADFSGQLLNSEAAEKLYALLALSGDSLEAGRKEFISLMPSLFFGFTLADVKALFRRLLSCCSLGVSPDPLAALVLSVLDVSRAEVAPLRFVSSGETPPIPLLPDLYPSGPLLTVSSLVPLLFPASGSPEYPDGGLRGLLAMLMLRQYRRRSTDEGALFLDRYSVHDSAVLRAWLSARNAGCVWIASLASSSGRVPFALVLPAGSLIPARFTASHKACLPPFASPWFDEENLSFRDPCTVLGENDRSVLLEQVSSMLDSRTGGFDSSFRSFLAAFRDDLLKARHPGVLPDRLDLRLKAAFGLRLLPAFKPVLERRLCFYEHSLSSDDMAARLLGLDFFPANPCRVPDNVVFLYRDVPFARENSQTLLEAVPLPAEDWILNLLDSECRTLARSSDDYHDTLVRELSLLLDRYPDALPEARETALSLLEKAGEPVTDTDTELVWPWDPVSPSVRTILSEALGDSLSESAVRPFSDRLTLFPSRGSEVIGDALMASMCVLPPSFAADEPESAVQPDSVLPPLSAAFSAALCRLPEGRTLVRPGFLSFEHAENNAVRVVLTLDGSFTVRLCRDYPQDEIIHLYAHDIPTLAVWPNLPFSAEDWHAYYVYAGLPSTMSVTIYSGQDEIPAAPESDGRFVCRSASFPLSFAFSRDGATIGALPNLLPSPVIDKTEPVTACIDFGSVGTSVVFSVGHHRKPLHYTTLVRTLINNPSRSKELLRKEFLPAVPVSALLPTVTRIFRNVPGSAPLPFEDGIILMSADLQDVLSFPAGSLYTCLKWEEDKGRSVSLCLHQIMLMAALQARSEGASQLTWRFSLPDEMAKAGRERLAALFSSLARLVCEESGFGIPEKQPAVTFAPESSALGAYFRLCASEDTRGAFMVLDIGACTADISLFLRGSEQALRTCQIPLGIHYMFLPVLLHDPGLLRQELGCVQDPSFQQDLLLLERILMNARADSSALRHSRLAIDNFIADRFNILISVLLCSPATGMPTRLGSVLLLHLSFLMMLSGLILLEIASDSGKNDFLPEQMSLCISGRGSLLMEYLPDSYRTALWHFLTMFRNDRVTSLSMLFSSEKKMEIPVGLSVLQDVYTDLPPASAVPASITVRPEELLPQFILRFAREFPASAEILFHGFFTGDFYHPFSPYGESIVSDAINHSFTEQTELRPYDALSAWITCLLDLIRSSSL